MANMVRIAAAVYTGGGPASTELAPDLTALDFIWKLGEHVAAGGDPRIPVRALNLESRCALARLQSFSVRAITRPLGRFAYLYG